MNRIKELRLLRGVTVERLARAVNVPLDTIMRLDKGETMTASNTVWNNLSNFFCVPVGYLMGFTSDWDSDDQRIDFLARKITSRYFLRGRIERLYGKSVEKP